MQRTSAGFGELRHSRTSAGTVRPGLIAIDLSRASGAIAKKRVFPLCFPSGVLNLKAKWIWESSAFAKRAGKNLPHEEREPVIVPTGARARLIILRASSIRSAREYEGNVPPNPN